MNTKSKLIIKYILTIIVVIVAITGLLYLLIGFLKKDIYKINNDVQKTGFVQIPQNDKVPSPIDKKTNTRILKNWEIPDYQTTDGGIEVVGFYKNNELYKISESVGLSWGRIYTEYVFDQSDLNYVYQKKEFFPPLDDQTGLNYEKLELAGEGKYYFTNNKLVKTDIKKGKYFANAGDIEALNEEDLLSDYKKYIGVFSK